MGFLQIRDFEFDGQADCWSAELVVILATNWNHEQLHGQKVGIKAEHRQGERTWVCMKRDDRWRDEIRPEHVEGEAGSVLSVQDPAATPQVIPDINVNVLQTCWPSTSEQRFTAACWTFISMLRPSFGVWGKGWGPNFAK